MKGVNHIKVADIRGCRLVCDVDRVFKRQIPDGKGFVFCIPCGIAALVLVIKLRQASRKLAASRSRSGDDDKRSCRLYIGIGAVAYVAYYKVDVVRIAFGVAVNIYLFAATLKLVLKKNGGMLLGKLSYDNRTDTYPYRAQIFDKPKQVHVVSYAKICPHFIALDICRAYAKNHFEFIFEVLKKLYFYIGVKAG